MEPIHRLIQDTLDEIRATKKKTEKEKDDLTEYEDEQLQLKEAQVRERKKLIVKQTEKTNLLKITKGVEEGYRAVMVLKQKEAAKIRSALFALRDTAEIPFGKALEYASLALSKTGVRPAFLWQYSSKRAIWARMSADATGRKTQKNGAILCPVRMSIKFI